MDERIGKKYFVIVLFDQLSSKFRSPSYLPLGFILGLVSPVRTIISLLVLLPLIAHVLFFLCSGRLASSPF
jgi:hypothetical protein